MYKHRFRTATEFVYLNTAAEGLPLPECEEAFHQYCEAKARGMAGRKECHAVETITIELAARLLGTSPGNIALLSSASEALNVLATSLDWKLGDQVIISDLEFPSNVLSWLRLKERGVEVLVVPSEGGALSCERIVKMISPRTRLLSLSLVSYKTGAYLPFVEGLAREAHRVGAVLSIDATQALGRCPVSLKGVDYLMSSSFKWLLGPHGLGIVYISPEFRERLHPGGVGWYSVKNLFSEDRFKCYELKDGAASISPGMPNFPSIFALRRSLEFLLGVGVSKIDEELKPCVARLREGLSDLDLDLLTPASPEYSSGIVSFAHPACEEIGAALEQQGVMVWAGDGRVRASVHLYNDAHDIEQYLEILKSVIAQSGSRYA